MKISFIGCGNMGFALMSAALRQSGKERTQQNISAADIYITDADSEKARNAAALIGAVFIKSNIEAAEKSDLLFLAVKPQILQGVLNEIAPVVKRKKPMPVLVSMAAGWTISKIQSSIFNESEALTSGGIPVVRIMPNTPALIGKGMIAVSSSPEVTPAKILELKKILENAGIVDLVDEHYMDAVTGLSGSGPAFVYLFIEALADGAVRAGFPRDKALLYAVQTVSGAAAMVHETGKHPGELKDMVTSPGGTTIAGIAALEDGAFRSTVMKAVEAAWKRSKELG